MKTKLFISALLISVITFGCGKDDDAGDDQPQEKQFLSTYFLEAEHIFAIGSNTEVGYFNVQNPYNEQMTVSMAGSASNIRVTALSGNTLLHNASLDYKVTYVPMPETSVDTKIKVYLSSFGTKDKRDSNEIRVKVTVK